MNTEYQIWRTPGLDLATFVISYPYDINFATPQTGTILYADDTVIYTKEELKTESEEHQEALERSAIWLNKNHLTLNADKTKTIRFYKEKYPSLKHS